MITGRAAGAFSLAGVPDGAPADHVTLVGAGGPILFVPGAGRAAWLSVGSASVLVMAFFALTLVHGPGWDGALGIRQQRAWDEHAAFMDGLVSDGLIVLGGPVGDGQRTLHVVEAGDEQEVRQRLAKDPWARMGLLEIGVIEPWAIWLDGRPPSPA